VDWNQNVKVYLEIVTPKGIPEKDRPQKCPLCGQSQHIPHRHGHFPRTVFSMTEPQGIEIPIFRFLCPDCDRTFSIIPSFVEKHHQMALDIKEKVIRKREEGATLPEVERSTIPLPGGQYSVKTIRRWTKVWNERLDRLQAEVWRWLLARLPHICFSKGGAGSLWLVFFELWEPVRVKFIDWRDIGFLHYLNRLLISMAVAA
jgi:hypothetical protein